MTNREKLIEKFSNRMLAVLLLLVVLFMFTACRESERVSYNISKEADNFNVVRRLAVINTVKGTPVFELVGRFSIEQDEVEKQLEIVVEVGKDKYKKHIIGLNDATTMYVVEDIDGSKVSKYKYEINYLPKAIQPFKFTSND